MARRSLRCWRWPAALLLAGCLAVWAPGAPSGGVLGQAARPAPGPGVIPPRPEERLLPGAARPAAPVAPEFLEDEAEGPFLVDASLSVGAVPAQAWLVVLFDYQNDQTFYELVLTAREAQFSKVSRGARQPLGKPGQIDLGPAGSKHHLTVQRGQWSMALIFDGRVVARGYDAELQEGRVGLLAQGCTPEEAFVQPTAEIIMTDDFMRTGDEANPWTVVSGNWQYKPLREEDVESEDPTRSANAFSYQGSTEAEPAIVVNDAWFWSDYRLSLRVKSEGSTIGAIFHYQDEQNYSLLRWTAVNSPEGGLRQLINVIGGERTVLAEKGGGFVPGLWYELEVAASQGLVYSYFDGVPSVAARTDAFGQGSVGLYVESGPGAFFDDVWVVSWQVLTEDFEEQIPGKWAADGGQWQVTDRGVAVCVPEGPSRLTAGVPTWQRYIFAADVKVDKQTGAGILAHDYRGQSYVLRLAPANAPLPYAGQIELARLGSEPHTIRTVPFAAKPGRFYRLRLFSVDGYLAGYVDEALVLEAVDATLTAGRIGLYAEGKGKAYFDNAYLRFHSDKRPVEIRAQFSEPGDESMVEWATKRGAWLPPADPDEGSYWHKGVFFGDDRVEFTIKDVGSVAGSVTATFAADVEQPDQGVAVVLTTTEGAKTVVAKVVAGQTVLAEGQMSIAEDESNARVRLARRGSMLLAYINDKLVLEQPLSS